MPVVTLTAQRVPYQAAGAITRWSHPFLLATLDGIPVLLVGSAVLIKPGEIAPRFAGPARATIAAVPELAAGMALLIGDG